MLRIGTGRHPPFVQGHEAFGGVFLAVRGIPSAEFVLGRLGSGGVLRDLALGRLNERLADVDVVVRQPHLDAALHIQLLSDHVVEDLLPLNPRGLRIG